MKIGFIGLGIMGESMCENIVKKHDDTVYCFDFIPAKVELLASKGAVPCKDSVEAGREIRRHHLDGAQIRALHERVQDHPPGAGCGKDLH